MKGASHLKRLCLCFSVAAAVCAFARPLTILSDTSAFTYPSSGPTCCIDCIMVDTPHTNCVDVTERWVITNPDVTDHCAVVVKADFSAK